MKHNPANNTHMINDLLRIRWSPRAFADKKIDDSIIKRLFEAARWAPSAFNEQPWRYIFGIKGTKSYEKIREVLIEFNQIWTETAPLLILNITKQNFTLNNHPNHTCEYDLGQSVANISIEAIENGLYSHQMSGFDSDKAKDIFDIPDGYHAVSVIAIGYLGDPDSLPENMREMETRERERNDFNSFVFTEEFDKKSDIF
ncbi:MAG: nitroreductase family protein [Hyphomicrobiales bacterium]